MLLSVHDITRTVLDIVFAVLAVNNLQSTSIHNNFCWSHNGVNSSLSAGLHSDQDKECQGVLLYPTFVSCRSYSTVVDLLSQHRPQLLVVLATHRGAHGINSALSHMCPQVTLQYY